MKVRYMLTFPQTCAIRSLTQIQGLFLNEVMNGVLTVEYNITSDQKSMLDSLLNQEGSIIEDKSQKSQWPQNGDTYYYFDSSGCVTHDHWNTPRNGKPTIVDAGRRDIGNIFKTEEEAMFEVERLKVLNQLKSLSDDDQPWDGTHWHYHIQYDMSSNTLGAYMKNCYIRSAHGYWFKSRKSAEDAIEAIGKDNLIKYVFNIKE